MKPVTTGPGISGTFNDELVKLVLVFRTQSNDQRWRLYIGALRSHGFSLRVYATDPDTEVYSVERSLNMLESIHAILGIEWDSWQSRVQAAMALPAA
jgi:hypothetical protein